jgi:hypothetical protein
MTRQEVEGAVEVLVGGDVARHEIAETAEAALTELRVHAHRHHEGHEPLPGAG